MDLAWLEQFNLAERNLISDATVVLLELGLIVVLYIILKILFKVAKKKLTKLQPKLEENLTHTFKLLNFTLTFVFLIAFFVVLALNIYQFYLGTDLKTYTLINIDKIPNNFWKNLGLGFAKLIGLFIVAKYTIKKTIPFLDKLKDKAVEYKGLKENNTALINLFSHLKSMSKNIIWLLVLYFATQWFPFPEKPGIYILLALRIYIIVTLALLVVSIVDAIVATLDDMSKNYAKKSGFIEYYDSLKHLIPVFKKALEYVIYVMAATLVVTQLDFISSLASYGAATIQAIGIVFISRVISELLRLMIDKKFLHENLTLEVKKRNETIFPIVKTLITAFIYFIALILILKGFGFDPIPLLAGAGILGMVIGLGAQQLINDLVSGFFLIMEQSIQKGDYVKVGDAEGHVESIGLRTTRIRSDDGQLHIIKNGSIEDLVNFSHEFVNAVVEVGVDASSNIPEVYQTLKNLGLELDKAHEEILSTIEIDGIEDISGPEIVIRTITRVKPGRHRQLKRMIQEKIITRFKEKGIEIPFEKRYDI